MAKAEKDAVSEMNSISKRIREAKKDADTTDNLRATVQGFQSRRLHTFWASPAVRARKRLSTHSRKKKAAT